MHSVITYFWFEQTNNTNLLVWFYFFFRLFLSWLLWTPLIMNRFGWPQWVCYTRAWLYFLDCFLVWLLGDPAIKIYVYHPITYFESYLRVYNLYHIELNEIKWGYSEWRLFKKRQGKTHKTGNCTFILYWRNLFWLLGKNVKSMLATFWALLTFTHSMFYP